jgi:hypothetical protein
MGCAGSLPASVAGGECKLFAPPDYAIRGKTQFDQNWIDDTEEAGIAGCKWSRPKARPAPIARVTSAAPHKAVPLPPVKSNVPAPPPVKKHWWQRIAPAHRT